MRNESNNPIKTDTILSLTNTRGVIPYSEKGDIGNKAKEDLTGYKVAHSGDIVLNSMNFFIGSVGISQYFGCVSPVYYVLYPQRKDDCVRFFHYFLQNSAFQSYSHSLGKGILDIRMKVSRQDFVSCEIPLPPSDEQQRIADFLDTKCGEIDEMIALQEKTVEELKAYKQSVITEAVTKGLIPDAPMKDSGIPWIGLIPEGWSVKPLKCLGWTQNGLSKSGDYFGEGYPFMGYGDVYKNMFIPETLSSLANSTEEDQNRYSIQEGDIFFTRTSETIEEIGFSSVALISIEKATFSGFLIRFRPTTGEMDKGYSGYYFRSNIHRQYFVKEMNLVTRASLGQGLLKGLPVLLPSLPEQQEIAAYLDKKCSEIDNLIDIKQQKAEELKTYKKSLIYEYVTGKKEVV